MEWKSLVQFRNVSGPPVSVGRFTLTPQARVLSVRLPFGGFVWNRATSVKVDEGGQIRHYPVVDVIRLVQWALTAGGLLVTVILRLRGLK